MRFCPFCSAENADELAVCASCGRRLPPLPPRRARNAPPTGVQLPPRAGSPAPPPVPASGPRAAAAPAAPAPAPSVPPKTTSPGFQPVPAAMRPPAQPIHAPDDEFTLLDAIAPGPAAQRREPLPPEPPNDASNARRKSDPPAGTPPPVRSPSPSVAQSGARPSNNASVPRVIPSIAPKPVVAAGAIRAPSSDDFNTVVAPPIVPPPEDEPVHVETLRPRADGVEPPPTRIHRPEALADRPFTPPKVNAIPEIPEPSLIGSARYTVRFWRARWQRRGAIKTLGAEIKQDTEALDGVLGALGRVARTARIDGRVFSAENAAISEAEGRVANLGKEHGDVDARKAEENSKFVDIERERNTKLTEAERMVEEAQKELQHLEGQRRSLRDKRKELERRQKAYLKAAEDNDKQTTTAQLGDSRQELRRSAEQHRREAAALEPDRQDMDRRLVALERPIGEATARLDAAKAELDAAKRSLSDAREGHQHRLDELDSEQKRKAREIAQAEAEIQRRLVTLGTLVNLNRIEDPQFSELYLRIDRLRGAITARTTEIEKLTAEREAYDRGTVTRGIATIGGAIVAFIALIVILRAII